MRLIDADEIKYEVHEKLGLGIDYNINESNVYYVAYKHQIDNIPTVDPVKHGHWIDATKEIGWPVWECSVCRGNGRGDYFVCPWCGAKMDEVER